MRKNFLGIDIGSVSVSVALLDGHFNVIKTYYAFHKGQITEHLDKAFEDITFSEVKAIGYTSSTPDIFKMGLKTDSRVAFIKAAKHFHPSMDGLLIIGAEKFGLVTFDENGDYLNYKSNTSCAAGTGNFLDQQVERMNLGSIMEFSRIAYENTGHIPLIASRCAVFAKTDLIHSQQEGYTLAEICDGLSYGLARNIVDAVSLKNSFSSLIAAGGVALNKAVIKHIESLSRVSIIVDDKAHLYGAIGAALCRAEENIPEEHPINSKSDILSLDKKEKNLYYPPLNLELSEYPDFDSHEKYEFQSKLFTEIKPVEIDLYLPLQKNTEIYMGIDVGSTSTKAVLINKNKEVVAGLYTRTSGRPLQAVQCIFEAIRDMEIKNNAWFKIAGIGTTGSGRKFTGTILGADIILDEITAHARAAFELNPETDTIIEIGGQDSKFTVMHKGMVTFSVMNNVCAAGTGSFIEEQAKRLNCPLSEFSDRASGTSAPLTSDRCTVFMERDLNHFLNTGYSVNEILAAVLHSTCENYLTKVAVRGSIGNKIFFQGATAKNKALVAAFEMKLKKPLMVSRYCHLAGAFGVALELHDKTIQNSKFRGIDLYKKNIPVTTETCKLCTNHCKLKVADIDGTVEAYGFLCGRDYATEKYVKNSRSCFQLINKRKEIFRFKAHADKTGITIGIPAGLFLYDDMLFWQMFFDILNIKTITSEDYKTVVQDGKALSGAEFCAPVAAMHGHVNYLMNKADYVFLPVYLQEHSEMNEIKQYCYYTQFISPVIAVQNHERYKEKIVSPTLQSPRGVLYVRHELQKMLKSIGLKDISIVQVSQAYARAKSDVQQLRKKWKNLYNDEIKDDAGIHVVLLGRPYTAMSPVMNSNIPELIEKNGVKTFFMDMLPGGRQLSPKTEGLLKTIKWKYAAKTLYAADVVAQTDNCYPVLVTSFKCTPDSFVIEYFKEILNSYHKPYLVLQLDEHDSSVGYETRIEAGIRAFRNHQQASLTKNTTSQIVQDPVLAATHNAHQDQGWSNYIRSLKNEAGRILEAYSIDLKIFNSSLKLLKAPTGDFTEQVLTDISKLKNKTLLLPMWDQYAGPLLEAVLINSGVDARIVTSTQESMVRSLSHNTGQCLPLSIIVQDSIDFITNNNLDPANTVIWNVDSDISCNLSMFPYFMKKLLNDHGKGMERISVYIGRIIFYDFSLQTAINAYLAYLFGGYLRRIGCMIRPYEKEKGATDHVIKWALELLYEALRYGKPKEPAVEQIVTAFEKIETKKTSRPKVAIFGDLYVRDNEMMNQALIKTVEDNGGEVITTSYSEYMKIIVDPFLDRLYKEGLYIKYARHVFMKSLIPLVEGKFTKYFYRIAAPPVAVENDEMHQWLQEFGLNPFHRGESIENILKIQSLAKNHPDLSLFIQTNPSYCCPSLVTEAMTSKIEEMTGIPVVTIEYDGTTALKNDVVIPYLKFRKKKNN
ncbi:MAG TPA: acyl-CoA dehydratase activase [Bacteroidales bacterium]|nr:acyl-CoA dehydratase activase [Bacteroidales bacterium]